MWRNISWNSTDSTLPDGMHKHEPGPYFKTPSIQSAASSASGPPLAATSLDAATESPSTAVAASTDRGGEVILVCSNETPPGQAVVGPDLAPMATPSNSKKATVPIASNKQDSIDSLGSGSGGRPGLGRAPSFGDPGTPPRQNSTATGSPRRNSGSAGQQQPTASGSAAPAPPQARRTRFAKDTITGRQQAASSAQPAGSSKVATPSSSSAAGNSGAASTTPQHQGFRSRLSSISGALQHPKLAKRLFHHGDHHQTGGGEHNSQASTVQITTTSIDSPQHGPSSTAGDGGGADKSGSNSISEDPPRHPMTSSSGRRLSQLFLPQISQNQIILNQMQDPYANNELFPPHLLGLYGQPPLVGGAMGAAGASGHRSSWADTSLFGRLSNVRPSLDSGYQAVGGAGQFRHSFDARK